MSGRRVAFALVAALAVLGMGLLEVAHAQDDSILARADQLNEEGKDLFGNGELDSAAQKFRAAIALTPQARYYFNLCFVLNARGELERALGACKQAETADGVDEDLRKRARDFADGIDKKIAERPPDRRPPPGNDDPPPRTGDPPPAGGTTAPPPRQPPPRTGPPPRRVGHPPPVPPPEPPQSTPIYRRWWFWGVIVVAALVIIAAAAPSEDDPFMDGFLVTDPGLNRGMAQPGGVVIRF